MTIFVPLGSDVNVAAEGLEGFVLEACPRCRAERPRVHDGRRRRVPLEDGTSGDVETRERRYTCRECGVRITVLPDCLVPFGRYPSASRDLAIQEYLGGRCTHRGIAAVVSCSHSTSWRWMRALAWEAGPWVQTCREQVAAAGEAVGPLVLPESRRTHWQRRLIRAAGMLAGLLLGEALFGWVERLRAAWRVRTEVLPGSFWSLCRRYRGTLDGFPTRGSGPECRRPEWSGARWICRPPLHRPARRAVTLSPDSGVGALRAVSRETRSAFTGVPGEYGASHGHAQLRPCGDDVRESRNNE